METPTRPDGHQKRPSKLWTIIAWVAVVFFAIAALGNLTADNASQKIGGFLFCLALAIPFAWSLYCRSRDKKAQESYAASTESESQLQQMLGNDYLGATQEMPAVNPPARKPRRWGWVAGIAVVVGIAGVVIAPTPEPSQPERAAEESTSPTQTPDNREDEERKAEEERRTKERAAESSRAKESEEREARESEERAAKETEQRAAEESAARESERQEAARERARQEEEARERETQAERDRIAREEAAAEQERLRNQQQQLAPPAPAPVPAPAPAASASYENCTDVWNRLGRPITAGEPGYTSGGGGLDRNSDGVGCESDPR